MRRSILASLHRLLLLPFLMLRETQPFMMKKVPMCSSRVSLAKVDSANSTNNMATTDTITQHPTTKDPFLSKVLELYHYKQQHGDTLVPTRYPPNPSLGKFVARMRKLYRKHFVMNDDHANTPLSTLTPERVDILNRLGFVWNATEFSAINRKSRPDEEWDVWFPQLEAHIHNRTSQYQRVDKSGNRAYVEPSSRLVVSKETAIMLAVSEIPRRSDLGVWLTKLRKNYPDQSDNTTTSTTVQSNNDKVGALALLDPHWRMASRDRVWRVRFQMLIAYQRRFGDTNVPISFRSKKLAHWVSTQRKNYNLKISGQTTSLTDERQQLLESIDFVWNRWEYEFEVATRDTLY
jgi:Helicase associated domain